MEDVKLELSPVSTNGSEKNRLNSVKDIFVSLSVSSLFTIA